MIGPALRRLVVKRLGFDPTRLEPEVLRQKLPEICAAVEAERAMTVEVVKSAIIKQTHWQEYMPNPGVVRDEHVDAVESESENSSDPNSVLNNLFGGLF